MNPIKHSDHDKKPTAARVLAICAAGVTLGGCAVHTRQEIATVRSSGVSEDVVRRIEHRGFLRPSDLIELRKRGVDDRLVIEHLDNVGIDYMVHPDNLAKLRAAGVRPAVIDALVRASDRFKVSVHHRAYYPYAPYPYPYGPAWYPYDPFYGPGPFVEVVGFRGVRRWR